MENIYYSPEAHGLTLVAEVDFADSYDFDKTVVWKDVDGQLYWAQDSGCSCPSPFENFESVASLDRLTRENWNYFEQSVRGRYSFGSDGDRFLREVDALL
jgi:hypothetical protein